MLTVFTHTSAGLTAQWLGGSVVKALDSGLKANRILTGCLLPM